MATSDIRFRLVCLDDEVSIDQKYVFNAPRGAMLSRVVPFLKKWLKNIYLTIVIQVISYTLLMVLFLHYQQLLLKQCY